MYDLFAWRVLQGFAGGVLIPLVFSAIFLVIPKGMEQTFATVLRVFLAVLGPALGPIIGGWLTEHYSWHWLFLINVVPGIVATAFGALFLPVGGHPAMAGAAGTGLAALLSFGVCLACWSSA